MKRLIAVFSFLFLAPVVGSASMSIEVYPLNAITRYERNEDQEIASLDYVRSFAAGASYGEYGFLVEFAGYTVDSGSTYSGMRREHREVLLWIRKTEPLVGTLSSVFGVGAGGYSESVTTRIVGHSMEDETKPDPIVGATAGLTAPFLTCLRFSFEARILSGANLDPNPMPEVTVRLGFFF